MEKVKVVPDKTMGALVRAKDLIAPTKVHVRLPKGTIAKTAEEAKGGTSSPLPRTAILDKFRTCAGRILSREKVENALDLLSTLESLHHVATLTETLKP
jgi:hemolysin activation/secretion protein